MKRYLYAILVSVILLPVVTSCKIGKKYVRPELNLPEAINNMTDSATVASVTWESLYTDPVLKLLIHQALDNNKDMLIASARIKEMMASRRISYADIFPQVSGQVVAQEEWLDYGGNNRKSDPEFGVKAVSSWELDFWGRMRWANDAAIAAYMQTVEARQALQLTVIAEVASNYYQLRALDNELTIVQQTLEARREGLRLARLRYEGGLTSETVYNQAQLELSRTQTLLPTVERKIELKENDLAMLLGEYPHSITRGLGISDQNLPVSLPVGLPSQLLERRPDMRQAEYQLREASARVGVAFTNLFPRISLTGNLGFESDELDNLLESPASFISGNLLQPIFAMGKNRAMYKAAQARYEQEVYAYERSVLKAFQEVSNSLVTLRKAKEIRDSRTELEEVASNYVQLAQLQYINGITNYMDVLDAQRGLFDAQLGLNEAILSEHLAVISLYKALGGGY